jgi:hypothetical protein
MFHIGLNKWSDLVPYWLEQVVRYASPLAGTGGQICSPIGWNRWSDARLLQSSARIHWLHADANYNIPHGNIVYVAFNDPDILKGRG